MEDVHCSVCVSPANSMVWPEWRRAWPERYSPMELERSWLNCSLLDCSGAQ